MDDRAKLLLKNLVERYIMDGQPVGSRTLSKSAGLDLSPATIRNVMSDLEALGLIVSPHTSAGRIPTARGYRLFVDTMLTAQPPSNDEIHHHVHRLGVDLRDAPPKQILNQAAHLLASLSHFVGLVTTPKKSGVFRHIEFVALSDHRLLIIMVSPEGEVQNRMLHTPISFQPEQLQEAAHSLNKHYAGLSLEEMQQRLKNEVEALRSEIALLMQTAVQTSTAASIEQDRVVIHGERNLLTVSDFSNDLNELRKMFDLFEQKTQIAHLLTLSDKAEGVHIYIGGENQMIPYEMVSVVTAPYQVNGQVVGTLGVIGPQRMAYDKMIHIVDVTAKLVSQALTQQRTT